MKQPIYMTRDNLFEYGYCDSLYDWIGHTDMIPNWSATHMGDGQMGVFETRAEMIEWMAQWYEITDDVMPKNNLPDAQKTMPV